MWDFRVNMYPADLTTLPEVRCPAELVKMLLGSSCAPASEVSPALGGPQTERGTVRVGVRLNYVRTSRRSGIPQLGG